MHVTMIALGSTGDVLPYTALGKGLKEAGCQVRFLTFERFESTIKRLGLDFHPVPGDPYELVAQGGTNMFSMAKSFGSLAKEYSGSFSSPHLFDTDLVINQLPGGMFGYDLAQKAGVPMMVVAVIPLIATDQFPMLGFPDLSIPGFNKLTYRLAEMAAWSLMGKEINRWRVEVLDLPRIKRSKYFDSTERLVIKGFSPTVVERPPEWEENVRITGYWFPDDPGWQPPDSLVKFLNDGPAPVFIGFGSMPVKDPNRISRIIMDALQEMGQRGVLGAGWGGLGAVPLPDSVYLVEYAPYDWLFPKMAMVVHHGGSGTTAMALRSGIPSCAIAVGFDQVFWGKRIAALGVGPKPLLLRNLTVEDLVRAIRQGVHDQGMRNRAAEVGRIIRAENGLSEAVELILSMSGKEGPDVR